MQSSAFEALLLQEVRSYTNLAVKLAMRNHPYIINDETMHEIEQHCPLETFLKIMLAGYPLQHIQKLEANNETLLHAVQNSATILAAKSA